MKAIIYALRNKEGVLYEFAVDFTGSHQNIINNIVERLNLLYDEININTCDQILSYLDLLETSLLVKVLDFSLVGESVVNSYYLNISCLRDISDIYDKICCVKESIYNLKVSKEEEDDEDDF